MNNVYHDSCCHDNKIELPSLNEGQIDDIIAEITNHIYKTKGTASLENTQLTRMYASKYWNAVKKGYGNDLTDFDYTTPDWNMMASLNRDVYHFSAAKDYQQLKSLSQAVIGEDGKILSFSDFKNAASEINNEYVNTWLKTEYDLAVSGSKMAGKWVDIQESGAPLLEFDAVMDNLTSALCSSLNGVVKPVNDPFWDIYYPPNHFRCRSTVKQRYSGAVTPSSSINYPDIPKMFQTNLAKDGLIFPKGSSYYKGLPADITGTKALRNDMRELAFKKVVGKTVEVEGIGEVHITKAGIRKCLTQNAPEEFYNKKNQLVPLANKLLENAHSITHEINADNPDLKVFKAKIKGLDHFKLVVKEEQHDGKILKVLYAITAHK